ncbi:acetyltransferase [Roseivivax halodurans JCM 10272]|uniref:Acetyltransferase n=1 Tax=Roseivivax halodurans JCM 10272 TaxID=1449350 RepID=X7E7I1_9RHOB|nr:GNAT family N-acetyltransferase [Roseivivax halodurans]ETX12019.1 acetyltransferase [Roseivivax halodurans JCM 10272]
MERKVQIRAASINDADGIAAVLRGLVAAGKRRKRSDPEFARLHYIAHPAQIRCSVAMDGDCGIVGFQSLKLATSSNPYGTPPGWGIVGTHILPEMARRGVGRLLFPSTLDAARSAGIPAIEAFIGATNDPAIAYYEAMGFVTYRRVEGVDCKRLAVS